MNGIILNALQVISTFDTFQNRSFANHWSSFASEIIMPFDDTMDFHPAYDFYKKGQWLDISFKDSFLVFNQHRKTSCLCRFNFGLEDSYAWLEGC